MSSPAETMTSLALGGARYGALDRALRQRLLATLDGLRGGTVTISDGMGTRTLGEAGGGLAVSLHVADPVFYRALAANGSVGAGDAYMDGLWTCDDLVALVRLLVRNRDHLDAMETGMARLGGWAMRALHAFKRNTRSGSQRNIAAHYDLGNDLFKLFLDENLMYSSAIFADPGESLESAQRRKLERICRKLDLQPSDHLVEIGTGWGGMALYAARNFGCRVTTTTISKEQHALAVERVAQADFLCVPVNERLRDRGQRLSDAIGAFELEDVVDQADEMAAGGGDSAQRAAVRRR